MADPRHSPGELLANKYRVVRPLSSGGMGEVLVATHEGLGHDVAVKLIRSDMAGHPDALARFHREARASATMTSAHVARVFDVDTLEDGQPYIVMELLVGSPLDEWIDERGPCSVSEAVGIILQLLAGLAEAHSLGIVHRDLKPSNIFVVRRPDEHDVVKILDFGISKVSREVCDDGQDLTATEAILGTPAYMSPEQIVSSRHVDGRADVWSVGVILYELLTGVCPFVGDTVGSTFAKVLQMPIQPPRELRPGLPPRLDSIVMRCLERDRDDRCMTVVELLSVLAPFAETEHDSPLQHVLEHAATLPLANGAARPSDELVTNLSWKRSPPRGAAARNGLFGVMAIMTLMTTMTIMAIMVLGTSASWLRAPAVKAPSPNTVRVAAPTMVESRIAQDQAQPDQLQSRERHEPAPTTISSTPPAPRPSSTVHAPPAVAPVAQVLPSRPTTDELELGTRQ